MENKLLGVLLVCILGGLSSVECIVGGHTSVPGAAPYMVSVQSPTHICGGVLVKTSWVLTTASCVQDKIAGDLKILIGSHRLLTSMARVGVSSKVVHSEYNPTSGIKNVALLKIDQPVAVGSVITLNAATVITGTPTVFYGWGSLSYGSSARSNELQTLYQKTLNAADCAKMIPSNVGTLPTGSICAQIQPGQAACSRDQGGPLVSYTTKALIGIYDHGVQCSGKYPDVFVDVATVKTWIDATAV